MYEQLVVTALSSLSSSPWQNPFQEYTHIASSSGDILAVHLAQPPTLYIQRELSVQPLTGLWGKGLLLEAMVSRLS